MLEILGEFGPRFVEAALATIGMSLIAFALAFVIGAVIAGFRVSPIPPLVRVATLYTEFFRNMPLAVLVVLVFFVLPDLDLGLSPFYSGVAALSLYTGAYLAEVIRSGINTVASGEVEAARAVGMSFVQVLTIIVLPQALRTVVPPIGNMFIAHTKNTTVAVFASAGELMDLFVRRTGSATANFFDAALIAAIFFIAVLIPVGALFGLIERRVAIKR